MSPRASSQAVGGLGEVGTALEAEQIVDTFVIEARREIGAASGLEDGELIASLPGLIDELNRTLDPGKGVRGPGEHGPSGAQHGRLRARQLDYTLNDVLSDFAVLSRIVL